MKKFLAVLLVAALLSSALIVVANPVPFGELYPSSQKHFGLPAPADGVLMIGEVIGGEESLLGGWSSDGERDPDTSAHAAFTGWLDRDDRSGGPFFDPMNANNPEDWCGLMMNEPYILTEIRLLPRDDQLGRHAGAAIYGFNGGVFDPFTATLIYEADWGADEFEFQIFTPSDFIAGSNTGFTHFAYFNEREHGDIMEIELYGNPANPPAAAPEPEAALGAGGGDAAELAAPAPGPAQLAPAPAPVTADMHIMLAFAVLLATAFITVKLTRHKNRA